MNRKPSEFADRGSFALVAYIPGALGAFLQSLRLGLPGQENPQAHITVLPPRPLRDLVGTASREAKAILGRFAPFAVELDSVKVFPETHILYLDIAEGKDELHQLHVALNSGVLSHVENFEFLPHLTLSGTIAFDRLARLKGTAAHAWKNYPGERRFEVREIAALWQPPGGSAEDWNRLWDQRLGDAGSSARAGGD